MKADEMKATITIEYGGGQRFVCELSGRSLDELEAYLALGVPRMVDGLREHIGLQAQGVEA